MFTHARACIRAWARDITPTQQALWNGPPPLRPTGPVHVLQHHLRQCGLTLLRDFQIRDLSGQEHDLTRPTRALYLSLEHALSMKHLRDAIPRRPNVQGIEDIDLVVTKRHLRNPKFSHRPELISLLTDGMWTAHRLVHTNHVQTSDCWWCHSPRQTPQHLFWECRVWQPKCPPLSQ